MGDLAGAKAKRGVGRTHSSGDRIGDGDARKFATIGERSCSDRGDGIGNGDVCEVVATIERIFSDRGDGIGDGDARGGVLAACQMSLRAVGIKQVSLLISIHHKGTPRASACRAMINDVSYEIKRRFSDRCNGIGNDDACEAVTITERSSFDRGYGTGDGDAREVVAIKKRTFSDGSDGIGDDDTREAVAIIERIASDSGDGVGGIEIGHRTGDDERTCRF